MAKRNTSSWLPKPTSSSELHLYGHGLPFNLDRELLAAKSAKVAALLKENPQENLSILLQDIPADQETCELVARFCHGFDLNFSAENVISLTCIAYYLEMTESHCNDNLLEKALIFFKQKVLPSWNETIKAFRSVGTSLQQAVQLGLFNACLESLVEKALDNPRLLGDPIKSSKCDEDSGDEEEGYRPNARRRLFDLDWQPEDLATLSLQLYQPIIQAMFKEGIPPEYLAASVCRYAEKWVFSSGIGKDDGTSFYRNSQQDVIEVVERLLPDEKGLIPSTMLFTLLKFAISWESSNDCRNGLEIRIGKQLDQATVNDLLIPSQDYTKEMQYDVECIRRILRHFYGNFSSSNGYGLIAVAELIEEFLVEVASDIDLKIGTFTALAEMSMAASLGIKKHSDGIYRAIDIYLDKHKYLTEMERMEVCRILDCHKMSPEACEHATKNERLPLRFVVQVLFVGQLQLREQRDAIAKEVQVFEDNLRRVEVDEEEENEAKVDFDEEEVRSEMEKMSIKVEELERESYEMRKEIENGCSKHKTRKGKISMWKEMKRKLGCKTSIPDCNCQVKKKKKVHPKLYDSKN